MEICFRYGVIVVTPDFIYDFRISWHIDRFKRRCEEAWNYVEYHIYGRLLPAQDERGYAGFWTGGNLPMGYVLDTREKIGNLRNPNYYRYISYEPHAEVIRWIFRRFQQLNGNVNALIREIKRKPLLFPDFDESIDPSLINAAFSHYTKVEGGYTMISDAGLRKMLMNRVYIGYWIYKGEVVSTENHEPIVDVDTFAYAYNRLSRIKLDGTSNEIVIERGKHYIKRHFSDRPAILKEVIGTEDLTMRIYARDQKARRGIQVCYGFYPRGCKRARGNATYTIVAHELDTILLEKLREHLQKQPETEKEFEHFTQEIETEVAKEASETLKDIERDIEATKAHMNRIKMQVESGKLTNPDLLEAADKSYNAAQKDLERLEERKKHTSQIANEDEERRSYKQLMHDVGDAWEEVVMPDEHPRLVYLFITSVTLEIVSPKFFTVTIIWQDQSWGIDTGLYCKGRFTKRAWTEEELNILREHYETAAREELMRLLPERSIGSMQACIQSKGWKLTRKVPLGEGPYTLSLKDWDIVQQCHLTEKLVSSWNTVKLVTSS
jgi:hypothetical protein